MTDMAAMISRVLTENQTVIGYDIQPDAESRYKDRKELSQLSEELDRFLTLLLKANESFNLTAIKQPEEAALRHFADSLTLLPLLPYGARVLDVGCGAGFPSVPLALARPDLKITAMDSTGKKVAFLKQVMQEFPIRNADALCERAESLSARPVFREHFDVVTARAVARLRVLVELCLPFVKEGGVMIAMKGPLAGEETEEAQNAIRMLGGEWGENRLLTLTSPEETLERSLILIQKVRKTPKIYPRQYAAITKNPL